MNTEEISAAMDKLADGNVVGFQAGINDILMGKMNDRLDARRIEIANNLLGAHQEEPSEE